MSELPPVDLVHPPPYGEVPFKHLGLCYVAAGLRAQGFKTRYHDLSERHHRAGADFYDDLILRLSQHAGDMSDLPLLTLLGEVLFPEQADSPLAETIRHQVDEALVELEAARVVGISFNTLTSYFTAALGQALRERGVLVLLGGPLSGFRPVSELMLRLGAGDALIAGDGELHAAPAVRALLSGSPPREVPGAQFLEAGVLHANPAQAPPDLDSLPWPVFEGNLLDQFIPLQASRGCSRSCAYCSERGIWGPQGHRRRAPKHVLEEMDARCAQHSLTDFHFHDDLLNGNRRWMDALVRELAGRRYTWESFFEPYGLDEPLLEQMRDAGCRLVKYGIQSFSPALLRRMKRPTNVRDVVDVVVNTYRLGISTHYDMLIGHPGETEEDHQKNLVWVEELFQRTGERLHFSLNPFYLSAGSEIQRNPEAFGVRVQHADPGEHPPPLAEALRAGPPYPVGYRSSVPRETTSRRMEELAAILRRHGKDYLYLGQREVPNAEGQPRRMLPSLEGRDHAAVTSREARARGDADLALPALVLRSDSNLRIFPEAGRSRVIAGPKEGRKALLEALVGLGAGGRVRIIGGEPTLSAALPIVFAAARRMAQTCLLETNGLRFSDPRFTQALLRHGLSHAVVLLLGLDAASADSAGGVDGSFEMALAGARALIEAQVHTEVGLVLTEQTLKNASGLSSLALEQLPGIEGLRVVVARLRGQPSLRAADPVGVERAVAALLREAQAHGQRVVLEDRG